MQGKGGFLRILEAFIAIAIIAGVMTFLYVGQVPKSDQGQSLNELIRIILEKIKVDDVLRQNVLDGDVDEVYDEIATFIPDVGELDFRFTICELNELCKCGAETGRGQPCPDDGREIYSDEVSVSVTLDSTDINPKVIRLFVWEK